MAANAWLAKLNVSPEAMCRCGHNAHVHAHGKSCTALVDESLFKYCKCQEFREHQFKSEEEIEMAKEKKARKPKGEGRTPRLAPFVKGREAFSIFITLSGKEYEARVHGSGMIVFEGKEFFSPSAAAMAINGDKKRMIDGWHFFKFNKDGKRVTLDTLRGEKSPLKCVEAPKKPRKTKSVKAKREKKPRTSARKSETATEMAATA